MRRDDGHDLLRRGRRGAIAVKLMGFLLVIAALVAVPFACGAGCTDEDRTRTTLRKAGYRDVTVGDYAWGECGKHDSYATEFTAINPSGERVSGTVCCGILKGCTVRF